MSCDFSDHLHNIEVIRLEAQYHSLNIPCSEVLLLESERGGRSDLPPLCMKSVLRMCWTIQPINDLKQNIRTRLHGLFIGTLDFDPRVTILNPEVGCLRWWWWWRRTMAKWPRTLRAARWRSTSPIFRTHRATWWRRRRWWGGCIIDGRSTCRWWRRCGWLLRQCCGCQSSQCDGGDDVSFHSVHPSMRWSLRHTT